MIDLFVFFFSCFFFIFFFFSSSQNISSILSNFKNTLWDVKKMLIWSILQIKVLNVPKILRITNRMNKRIREALKALFSGFTKKEFLIDQIKWTSYKRWRDPSHYSVYSLLLSFPNSRYFGPSMIRYFEG